MGSQAALYENNKMISQDEFSLFDPQKMRASVLPDKPGNYIIAVSYTHLIADEIKINAMTKFNLI